MNDITISAIAWASLVTPLGIAAGCGWMRTNRLLKNARDCASHWFEETGRQVSKAGDANRRATDLEDRLRKIERQRSDTTRKGNLTKAAKRKALQAATTATLGNQLQRSVDQALAA